MVDNAMQSGIVQLCGGCALNPSNPSSMLILLRASLLLAVITTLTAPIAASAQGSPALSDADVKVRVEQLVRTHTPQQSQWTKAKGFWPRATQIDAYELMIRLEAEGRGALAEPLYRAHFGSRREALAALAETAVATGRPREAQQLREALLKLDKSGAKSQPSEPKKGSPPPSKAAPLPPQTQPAKGSSAAPAFQNFAQLAALASDATNAGDITRGEEVARQALRIWVDAKSAGRPIPVGEEIMLVRGVVADAARERGDVLAAADLLSQNVADAVIQPATPPFKGGPLPRCQPWRDQAVSAFARLRAQTGVAPIEIVPQAVV